MTREHTTKHRFFVPLGQIADGQVVFSADEARHAASVLRLVAGQLVTVVDGAGGEYIVELNVVGKRGVIGTIQSELREVGEPGFELTIGMALIKNPSRFETFLEKSVELGVRRIIPLETTRTERSRIKMDRCQRILQGALKQSERSRLTSIEAAKDLVDVLSAESQRGDIRLICHEGASEQEHIRQLLPTETAVPARVTVLIGPEGGFTDEEIQRARDAKWQVVGLGGRRLRAETAAIAVATYCSLVFGDRK